MNIISAPHTQIRYNKSHEFRDCENCYFTERVEMHEWKSNFSFFM